MISKPLGKLAGFFRGQSTLLETLLRNQATDVIEFELSEIENLFAILVLGSLIGIPTSPTSISLSLLPLMEDEIVLMFEKIDTANAPVSTLFSVLNVG